MSTPSNIPLRGAVDLSALAKQREAEQRLSSTEVPPGVVIDVTEATFASEVLEQSQRVPVVLDLWATWCEPCKSLSPILEALAADYGGRFILAKVDVDAEQRIAAAFQVQSIPSVFAVIAGQPVPLFQGALPEQQVRAYLDEMLKVAAENGVAGTATLDAVAPDAAGPDAAGPEANAPEEEPDDPRFAAAYDAIESGDWDGAASAYRQVLVDSPSDPDALAGVALCELQARVDAASESGGLREADLAAVAGDWAVAFDTLIALVRESTGADRDSARERLVSLFVVAGDDPAVPPARIALASALF